ncbi:MAG: hypothetical protein KAS32_00740 [Candidatus Peribacteraceae bacterium]|nr:hypothetical protein [Candidatus Peribacteraceae bacterium]
MSKECPKLCVFCTSFNLDTGDADTFSEHAGNMKCQEGHFDFRKKAWNSGDDDSLRSVIFKAETCKDYKQVKI